MAKKNNIAVGNRYRIYHLCVDNDRKIINIDFETGLVTVEKCFGIYNGYKEPEKWQMSMEGIVEYLKPNQAYQWIQVDENRHDIN
jgi:hypothetical protein